MKKTMTTYKNVCPGQQRIRAGKPDNKVVYEVMPGDKLELPEGVEIEHPCFELAEAGEMKKPKKQKKGVDE